MEGEQAQPHSARYRRQTTGDGWIASSTVDGSELVAHGRSLESARRAIVGEISAATKKYFAGVPLEDDIALPAKAAGLVDASRAARDAAATAAEEAQRATAKAVRSLLREGLSLRDAGYVLGLSHARVQQIADAEEIK